MSKPNLANYLINTEAAQQLRELAESLEGRINNGMPVYVQTNVFFLDERHYQAWKKLQRPR